MDANYQSRLHNKRRRWEIEQKYQMSFVRFVRHYYQEEMMSCDEISEMLKRDSDIKISPKCISRWLKSIGTEIRDRKTSFNLAIKRGRMSYEHQRAVSKIKRKRLSTKMRLMILQRDHFTCQFCGRGRDQGAILEADHIIPSGAGGQTVEENLRTLCWECHDGKKEQDKETIREFRKKNGS